MQLSILKCVRISWLQLPFYTTWYLNYDLIFHGSLFFWTAQIVVSGFLCWLAIWAFRNINYKKLDSKWVQNFMRGYGFNSVNQAIDFIKEIEEFKKGR